MIYLYENRIIDDLRDSFDVDACQRPVVSVVPPDDIISIAAQVQDDLISFPIVALSREGGPSIDTDLTNFTRAHEGVATVFDNDKNNLYMEKVYPIKLGYELVVMATNTADIDEIVKELLFKYSSMYFLTLTVPYESKRKIRFGIVVDNQDIEYYTTTSDYLKEGKLHSAGLHLRVEGAVLVSYTPVHLRRIDHEIEPRVNGNNHGTFYSDES